MCLFNHKTGHRHCDGSLGCMEVLRKNGEKEIMLYPGIIKRPGVQQNKMDGRKGTGTTLKSYCKHSRVFTYITMYLLIFIMCCNLLLSKLY